MAELMFGLGQTKKKKETASKVKATKDERWKYKGNASEDAEAVSRKEHHDRDQGWKATQKDTAKKMADVNVTETVETEVRKEQHGREKDYKATQKDTKTNLKDVNVTETVETEVRKEQHGREKDWKDKGRQQKQENTSFDMAKALFN